MPFQPSQPLLCVLNLSNTWVSVFPEIEEFLIMLFELPPISPKLNGHVERANRTHREEFYKVEEIDLSIEEHNRQLEEWEYVYNHIRPHQALDYLTPNEYYQLWLKNQKSECH